MGTLLVKPSVRFEHQTIGGACLIAALFWAAHRCPFDLVITSGSDGEHSGPDDPHHMGNAFDVRSHDLRLEDKQLVLHLAMGFLAELTDQFGVDARVVNASDGLATGLFFGYLEDVGSKNEHYHWQVRKGKSLPLDEATVRA